MTKLLPPKYIKFWGWQDFPTLSVFGEVILITKVRPIFWVARWVTRRQAWEEKQERGGGGGEGAWRGWEGLRRIMKEKKEEEGEGEGEHPWIYWINNGPFPSLYCREKIILRPWKKWKEFKVKFHEAHSLWLQDEWNDFCPRRAVLTMNEWHMYTTLILMYKFNCC